MRDRLSQLIYNELSENCGECSSLECTEKLTNYLLANGVIVPPCKVGDTVWVYDFMWGLIPCTVDKPYHCFCGEEGGCTFNMSFTDNDIGKTVFLTREEAEQALKGR